MANNISGVGNISSAGLGSGLDVNSIVSSMMALEARPLDMLKTQASSINTKISTFGKLQSLFSALRDKANGLSSATTWNATTATASDTSAVKVSTGPTSAAGNYAVNVQKLAASQSVVGGAVASASAELSMGELTIELGSWTGDPISGFAPKSGGSPVVVSIAEGETSLTAIRDKINSAGAGVVASIVNDASGARLAIRSKETGEESAFRISAVETFDDGVATSGLSMLSFDLAGGASQMTRTKAAANALVQINGIDVTSASNTLSDVVDGLTMTLTKETTSPIDVTVAADTASIKTKITEFITAYNELSTYLRSQTSYNADSGSGGPLQGDSSAVGLQNQLRGVLNAANTSSTTWSRLSDVGITMGKDGKLSADATRLDNALNNLPELRKLLATDGDDEASTGFLRRYKEMADAALSSSGTFYSRTQSLQDQLRRNTARQDDLQRRLDLVESRMRKQYQALDATMATLNGLSGYVSQQIAQMSKSSDK